MNRVLILGGYGHFGIKISEALIKDHIPVIIAGRTHDRLDVAIKELKIKYPKADISGSCIDIHRDFTKRLQELKPSVVIHTCGPFQKQNYDVAKACIESNIYPINLKLQVLGSENYQ